VGGVVGGGSAEDGSGEHNMVVGSSKSHVRQHSVLPGTAVGTQQQRRTQSRRGIRAKHPLPFLFKSDIYVCVLFFFIILFVMRKCKYAADTYPRRPPPPAQLPAPNAARLAAVAANAGLALDSCTVCSAQALRRRLGTCCLRLRRLAACDLRHPVAQARHRHAQRRYHHPAARATTTGWWAARGVGV
jgi:hypothetical protein